MQASRQEPFVVTVIQRPAHTTTLKDVVLGSMGLAGVLLMLAILLGGVLAFVMVAWHRRHPPEARRLPPVSPLTADSTTPPPAPPR